MPIITPLPGGLRLWQPAPLLATWFGSGLLPKSPGTWGSLAALPFAWVIQTYGGSLGLVAAAALAFAIGCWASGIYIAADGHGDPGAIVIDEVAGQWLTLAVAPLSLKAYAVGFVLFRLFDIIKPWPISALERAAPGAFGVMIDDIAAAVFAAVLLIAIHAYVPLI